METREVKLGEVATVKGGKRLPKGINLITKPNSHPYIRVRDLNGKRILELDDSFEFVDDETQKAISRYIVTNGDIVLSIVGTIGLVSIVGDSLNEANLTENCVKLTPFSGIDRDYLYYYLRSSYGQQEIARGTVGAVQAKLPIKNIQDITIPLPDEVAQGKIAAILSSLDTKIEINQRINDNLQQQAAALFSSLYDRSNTEVRFTDLIQILGGGTPKTGESTYWNGNIAFFTPKDVGAPYTLITEKTITENGLSHCNSRLYPVSTVFVTARGTVGKVGMSGVPMAMNQSCYALVGKETHQLLVYFYTLKAVDRLKHKASGAVFDAITTIDFESEQIMKLSNDDARAFLCIAEPMFQNVLNNCIENLRLSTLRDSLLPKLISGEIDVSAVQL